MLQLLDGLRAIHRGGVVHRGVRPSCVRVVQLHGGHEVAKITGFDDAAYELLASRADCLAGGLAEALSGAGLEAEVPRFATLVGLFLGRGAPVDYEAAQGTDEVAYAAFFHAMLDRGVALAPGAYEVLFPGLAHGDAELEHIVDAAAEAAVVASTRS